MTRLNDIATELIQRKYAGKANDIAKKLKLNKEQTEIFELRCEFERESGYRDGVREGRASVAKKLRDILQIGEYDGIR